MVPSRKERFSMSRRGILIAGMVGLVSEALPRRSAAGPPFVPSSEAADRRFAVFYKGDKIGAHTVTTTPETGETRINTEIVLVVKAFFFTMFSFSHHSEERWQNDRLISLKSETVEHGEKLSVAGNSIPQGFRVIGKGGPFIAPADALTSNCLWSPAILDQETVIDAQHGGIIGLSARRLADERLLVLGRQVAVTRYRFITPYLAGSIWYDDAGRWVHGEFERDGAMIEYRLEA
jgi:Domain of unknown function (DUF6134)